MRDYNLIDSQIHAWAQRHDLSTPSASRELRNVYVSSINGDCFQIWIETPADDRVTVHAAGVGGQGAVRFPKAWRVPIADIDVALEQAFKTVSGWMAASERYYPKTDEKYEAARRDLKIRRITSWGIFLGYVPGLLFLLYFLVAPLARKLDLSTDVTGNIGAAIAIIWMLTAAALTFWHGSFRCPRCDRPFNWRWSWSNPLTRQCLHCGLRIGEHPTR